MNVPVARVGGAGEVGTHAPQARLPGRPVTIPGPPPPAVRGAGWMVAAAGLVLGGAYLLLLVHAAQGRAELWGALAVTAGLSAVSVPLLRRATRADTDVRVARIIPLALVLKLTASAVRYLVAFDVYGGAADARRYAQRGAELAAGSWWGGLVGDTISATGTEFIERLTGLVFAITTPSTLGGFLVFSWLGFWGLYLFYRAFRTGFPAGDHRRYALLVFLLPSLLFWPSSIGKEAWMLLALGLAAVGAARLLTGQGGYLVLAGGIAAAGIVRPHVALLLCVAVLVGFVRRRPPAPAAPAWPVIQVLGLAVLAGAALLILQQTTTYFDVRSGSVLQAAGDVFEVAEGRTGTGGSEFSPPIVRSPLDLPYATATVLFRPFPTEAHNLQSRVAAAEGVLLLVLFAASAGRLVRLPRTAWQHPYVLAAVTYIGLFVVAFSRIGNFGILARQRTQVLPLVLMLLALPAVASRYPARRGAG